MQLAERLQLVLRRYGYHFQSYSYERRAGLGRVTAWHFYPETSNKNLVLFVHGAGNDCVYPHFSCFLRLLQQGFEVFTFDLDGHGVASSTYLEGETVGSCLEDAISHLPTESSARALHLVGHSFGGALVLHYLANAQMPQAASACLISTPLHLNNLRSIPLNELLGLMRVHVWRQVFVYGLREVLPAIGSFRREAFPVRLRLAGLGKPKAYSYLREVTSILDSLALQSLAAKIKTPTLLCYGSRDGLVPAAHGRILAHVIRGAKFVELPREGHITTLFSPILENHLVAWIKQWSLKAAAS